jgi:replicative DNA helicase
MDLEAEQDILGQCIVEPGDIDLVIGWGLQPGHFSQDQNRRIFDAILRVHGDASMSVDIVAVAAELRYQKRLDQVGGSVYLATLAQMPFQVEKQLSQRVRMVIDHWRARQAISIQQVGYATLYQPMGSEQLQSTLENIEQQLWEVTHGSMPTSYVNAGVLAHDALTEMSALLASGKTITGLTTGFADLDAVVTGYHAGDLMILAGRPGMGKSSALCSSLLRATRPPTDGSPPPAAYLHSLEMPKEQIALRLVCSYASVEFQKIRLNKLQQHEWGKLFDACKALMAHPILIDDKPAITVAELRSNIRKIKREIELGRIVASGLVLVAVDYLQLMRGEQGQGREREVASLTSGLKNTAKTEKVCMLALSQLNRGVENRGGKGTDKQKRPQLQDLRESGAIEQDADTVMFLFRPKYYDKEVANDTLEIIIEKNRNGPTCIVELAFEGATMTVKSLVKGYTEFEGVGEDAGPGYFNDENPMPEDWRDK